jgi:hypothetical protein
MKIPKEIRETWRAEHNVDFYILYHEVWRKKYGWTFYREPCALQKWKPWGIYIKKTFPIQYFFREFLRQKMSFILNRITDKWHYLKCYFWHKYNIIKINAPPTWIDSDTKISGALEKILFDFIEKEKPSEKLVLDSTPEEKEIWAAIYGAYSHLKIDKSKLQNQIDEISNELFGGDFNLDDLGEKETLEEKLLREKLWDLEKELTAKDTEAYLNIVKYRERMWT